jgi:hypothetical protein
MPPYRTPAARRPLSTFRVTRWAKLALIWRNGRLWSGTALTGEMRWPARPWLARWLRVLLGLPWPTRRGTPVTYRKGTSVRTRHRQ